MPKEKRASRRDRDGGDWTPTGDVPVLPTVEPPDPGEEQRRTDMSCPECGAVVSSKSLKRHIREQHSQDAFVCRFCSFRTKRADGLERHEKAQHEALYRQAEDAEEDEAPAATQEPVVRGGADSASASTSWGRRPGSPATTEEGKEEAPTYKPMEGKEEAPTYKPMLEGKDGTPTDKPTPTLEDEAPLMPRPLRVVSTCALPPAMSGAHAAAKPRSHVNVHGLRDFAPPQGYAWAFNRPAELSSLVEVADYVAGRTPAYCERGGR